MVENQGISLDVKVRTKMESDARKKEPWKVRCI